MFCFDGRIPKWLVKVSKSTFALHPSISDSKAFDRLLELSGGYHVMNNPIVIGAIVGALVGISVALVMRLRAGHWPVGTAVVVAIITGVSRGFLRSGTVGSLACMA